MIDVDDLSDVDEALGQTYVQDGNDEDDVLLGEVGESFVVRKGLTPRLEDEED